MYFSMISAESLLIRQRRIVDPFGRMGSVVEPTLLAVEFCQFEGPRPLFVHPLSQTEKSLDLDALSVWLMSSETATGTILSLYNQQMAVYAISYYCSFYDIRARAFQRPVCFAYLTSEKPNSAMLIKFSHSIRKILCPVLICNRRCFLSALTDMHSFINDYESHPHDSPPSEENDTSLLLENCHRYRAVSEQVKKLFPRVHNLFQGLNDTADSECGIHNFDEKSRTQETLGFLRKPGPLNPLNDVAPCTFGILDGLLQNLLSQLSLSDQRRGVLYSSNVPVLRFSKVETPVKESKVEKNTKEYTEREHTLKTITPHLDNLLYPLLAGDDLVVCGSKQRKRTVVDIVGKLNDMLPRTHSNYSVTAWEDDAMSLPHGVVGLSSSKTSSVSLPAVNRAILDVNTNMLRMIPYQGVLLSDFHQRRRFPSDESLVAFISAVISRVCSYVYLARHVPLASLREDGLTVDDEKIITNLLTELDFVKFQMQRCALEGKRSNSVVKCINL